MTRSDSQSQSGSRGSPTNAEQPPKQRRKPGRVPVSCAECRRLKLRCDRKVPCETCVKRGCSAICPEGSLTTGNKTNRLAFADAEELQKKIERLRSRVSELEAALGKLQSAVSDEPHPLLLNTFESSTVPTAPTTLPFRTDPQPQVSREEDDFVDAFGTLTLGLRGESRFYGPTSRAEFLVHAAKHESTFNPACLVVEYPRFTEKLFDEAVKGYELSCNDNEVKKQALQMLPSLSQACRLCDIFLEHGQTLWKAIPRTQLYDEILSVIYRSFPHPPSLDDPSLVSTHAAALLFIIFGLATLFDPEAVPYSPTAKEYFLLSRLALRFSSPILDTTLWAVQTMVYQVEFMQLSAKEPAHTVSHQSWLMMGLAVKLGNSIGLHVKSSKWQLDEEASRRRARIFWQLFSLDTWLSFNFGRPPCMSLAFIDCEYPTDPEGGSEASGHDREYYAWSWRYTKLVAGIMSTAFGAKTPSYSTVIDLDRKIRDFPIPSILSAKCGQVEDTDPGRFVHVQRYLVMASKEIIILHLHRPYFAQALSDMPHDLLKHRFGPSLMATYRSSWRLIEALRDLHRRAPFILGRIPLPWSYSISAAIAMCLLATRAPMSPLAPASVHELDRLVDTFAKCASTSQTASINLEVLQRLQRQAREAATRHETQDSSHPAFSELDRLGGKTRLISTDMYGLPGVPSPDSCHTTSSGSSSALESPPSPPTPPSLPGSAATTTPENVHPLLVSDMRTFENFDARATPQNPTLSAMDFNFDLSQAFPLPLESQYGYYHAHREQQEQQQSQQQYALPDFADFLPPMPDFAGYPDQQFYSAMPMDIPGSAQQQEQQQQQQQHQVPPVGVQGMPMPVLDATWQSFVEQLGF